MKAVLDHVGIAVQDLDKALAFFRDALGLEVEVTEEVYSQRVRAHFIATGPSALELLEATASESAIAKYIDKRGPGLHHITLRVPDIRATLAQLKTRGVRLVDEQPRPGAEGALVAFIHPSAAHGVLVELKQAARRLVEQWVTQTTLGDLRLTTVSDGSFRLDGGAMFGVVPRPLWEKKAPPDDRGRIVLAMRALLVEAEWGRMLIDCGAGGKLDAKWSDIFGLERTRCLDHTLEEAGVAPEAIDVVLPTHLHFDHMGGAVSRTALGLVPHFPKARYVIRRGEWDAALEEHPRSRGSYFADDFLPLEQAGRVDFFDDDREIKPGVRVVRACGHTAHHQVVYLESGGKTAVFAADVVATQAHIQDNWIAALDLFPMESFAFKQRFLREAIDREHLIFFDHDPSISAGYIREKDGKRFVQRVI
jgi:methylmalonyl-CoA epimerase